MGRLTYRDAGVDVDKKHGMLAGIAAAVASTFGDRVLHQHGAFGGLFAARFAGLEEPVLVATNDGVGTKVRLAVRTGRVRGLGHDIVNHCVNDALVQGAEPLFFLDYFAASRLDERVFSEVVEGLAEACRGAGAALLGGETAEMPGVYAPGEFDLVGFLVGVVDRKALWPRDVRRGDALLGLRSSGLHTNGFSLVNRLLERDGPDLVRDPGGLGEPLVEALLRPHRSYLRPVQALRDRVPVKGLAHVTGGGFAENLPRILPPGLGAALDRSSWTPNPVFRWILDAAAMDREEAYRVFNMGLGMVVVVAPEHANDALAALGENGQEAWVAGFLEEGRGVRFLDGV
jgi:phosphoribosylformylglycinamidine cyclo-ligase